jgi:predicted PurR-regulated permease PerM
VNDKSEAWFYLALGLLGAAFIYLLSPILSPFLIGALLAYMGDPLVDRLEARKLPRAAAVCVVFTVLTLLLVLALLLLVPMLGRQIDLLIEKLPHWIFYFQSQLLPWVEKRFGVQLSALSIDQLNEAMSKHWQQAGDVAATVLKQVSQSAMALFGWIANITLIPVVAFYLLRDWDLMIAKLHDLLPRTIEGVVGRLARECDEVLSAFLRGQLAVMAALAVIYSIGLAIVGVDLALLLGTLAGLAAIVPYMGFIVGIVASGVAAYLQFHEWMPLLYVAIVFGVGQTLEGTVLTPMLVGNKIGLHPVAVIFAIMAGGQLAGFVGVLLALPVAAIVMVLLRYVHRRYKDSAIYQERAPQRFVRGPK